MASHQLREPPAPGRKHQAQTRRTSLWRVKPSSEIRNTKLSAQCPPRRHPRRSCAPLTASAVPPQPLLRSLETNGPQLCQLSGLLLNPLVSSVSARKVRPWMSWAVLRSRAHLPHGVNDVPILQFLLRNQINNCGHSWSTSYALPTCIISSSETSQF